MLNRRDCSNLIFTKLPSERGQFQIQRIDNLLLSHGCVVDLLADEFSLDNTPKLRPVVPFHGATGVDDFHQLLDNLRIFRTRNTEI
jgi:hypothetical protein